MTGMPTGGRSLQNILNIIVLDEVEVVAVADADDDPKRSNELAAADAADGVGGD